ncbi:hypothetical protein GF407_03690 [candidate division KSB1 bacterium]|nr:hypothetical protein [candidate division KSB1 bacterium]
MQMVPTTQIRVRTCAPQWLFSPLQNERFKYKSALLDVGALQKNSFSVNKEKTLKSYAGLIKKKKALLEKETAFLIKEKIDLVISDITPLAFDAAKECNIPAYAVGNFSWDWIYKDWLDEYEDYRYVIEDIENSYRKADGLFRLPFYGDMEIFKNIVDVPLVVRKARIAADRVKQKLNFPADKKCILLALRDTDLDVVDWTRAAGISEFCFVSTSEKYRGGNIHSIKEGVLPFEQVLNACDAVLSKPGYGIVSDCIGNQKRILYIPRQDFIEDSILRHNLEIYSTCEEMSLEQYKKGDWLSKLKDLLNKPDHWPPIQTNGSEKLAEKIHSSMARHYQ